MIAQLTRTLFPIGSFQYGTLIWITRHLLASGNGSFPQTVLLRLVSPLQCLSTDGLLSLVVVPRLVLGDKYISSEVHADSEIIISAGVSGSCWLQTLYNSSLGGSRHEKVIEHLKKRIGVHIAYPPSILDLCTRAPTNKFLLAGSVERLRGDPQANFGLVDVYGLLLSGRLMIPRDELSVDDRDLKLSNQRFYLARGANPLPIYAAVRHEIPLEDQKTEEERVKGESTDAAKEKAKQEAWFQWFEFTPYEFFCEDFEAGIPSWSIGRRFQMGRSVNLNRTLPLPELRIPLLMGIWGSAFCATVRTS